MSTRPLASLLEAKLLPPVSMADGPSKMMLGISGYQWMVGGVADFQMRFRPKDGLGRDPPGQMGSEVPMWI